MRITILQGAFLPVPTLKGGAVEKLWFALGKKFRERGHHVNHISRTYPGLPDKEIIEGVHHIRVKGYETPKSKIMLKALDYLYSKRALKKLPVADILITNTFWMPILAQNKQENVGKIMVSVERMPKGQFRFYNKSLYLRACSSAVLKAIELEVPRRSNMIRMIPNPIPNKPELFKEKKRKKLVLYCGRMHPEKGIEILIDGYIKACKDGLEGWRLRLVGPAEESAGGGGRDWLKSLLIKKKSQNYSIEWIGPIYEDAKLASQYEEAAIFVYPSIAERGEAMPVAPLEAMAYGAVPIVSNLECFRDYIKPNSNGFIIDHRSRESSTDLANKIRKLDEELGLWKKMSESALEVRQEYNIDVIANRFLSCFKTLVEKPY